LRSAIGAVLVLDAGKSCLKAREKLDRRESDGIRGFDMVMPIVGQSMGYRMLVVEKVPLGFEGPKRSSAFSKLMIA
jgi:hypothetical protein